LKNDTWQGYYGNISPKKLAFFKGFHSFGARIQALVVQGLFGE